MKNPTDSHIPSRSGKLLATGQPLNGEHASPHLVSRRRIRGVHDDFWRLELAQRDGLFNPKDDIVASAPGVISQVMVQADFLDGPGFE